jgi:hypothetical protein
MQQSQNWCSDFQYQHPDSNLSSIIALLLKQQRQWNLGVLSEQKQWAEAIVHEYKDLNSRFRNLEASLRPAGETERQWIKRLHQSLEANTVDGAQAVFSLDLISIIGSWGLLIIGCAFILKVCCAEYYSYLQRVKGESEYSAISIGEFLQYRLNERKLS